MFLERNTAAALVALVTIGCAQAGNAKLHGWCVPLVEANGERIQCHVRSDDGTVLSEATATLAGRQRLKGTREDYNSDKYTSAWYFLIQNSGVTPAHLAKMSKAVGSLASFEGKQCVAMATYSDSLLQRTQCGAIKSQVERALRDIQSAPPSKRPAALYRSARDAISKLDALKADRKALVILSNGVDEDDTVTEANVASLARAKNIIIYGLFFGDRSSGRPQSVSSLAEKTFGISRDYSDQSAHDISSLASNFTELLENGVVLKFDAKDFPQDAEITLSARLRDNTILTTAPVAVHRITQDTFLAWFRRLILDNLDNFTMLVAAAALILGLLLIRASLRGSWRTAPSLAPVGPGAPGLQIDVPDPPSNKHEPVAGGGPAAVADTNDRHMPDKIYGWLQFLDAGSTQVQVTATSLRIGRHPDNDICIPNKSVHRQHAVLHKTTNGAFVIRDLGTKNGVIVNGKRCSQHSLQDNDLIELGEVRLRFVSNKEEDH